jgi:hypothetical protein
VGSTVGISRESGWKKRKKINWKEEGWKDEGRLRKKYTGWENEKKTRLVRKI